MDERWLIYSESALRSLKGQCPATIRHRFALEGRWVGSRKNIEMVEAPEELAARAAETSTVVFIRRRGRLAAHQHYTCSRGILVKKIRHHGSARKLLAGRQAPRADEMRRRK